MRLARQPFAAVAPLPWLVAGGLLVGPGAPVPAGAQPDLSTAVVSALARDGIASAAEEVTWLDPPSGLWGSLFTHPRAVLRGHREGEPADVYLVHAEVSPEGRLRRIVRWFNVTDTSAVDERDLTAADQRFAWSIGDDRVSAALAPRRPPTGRAWRACSSP